MESSSTNSSSFWDWFKSNWKVVGFGVFGVSVAAYLMTRQQTNPLKLASIKKKRALGTSSSTSKPKTRLKANSCVITPKKIEQMDDRTITRQLQTCKDEGSLVNIKFIYFGEVLRSLFELLSSGDPRGPEMVTKETLAKLEAEFKNALDLAIKTHHEFEANCRFSLSLLYSMLGRDKEIILDMFEKGFDVILESEDSAQALPDNLALLRQLVTIYLPDPEQEAGDPTLAPEPGLTGFSDRGIAFLLHLVDKASIYNIKSDIPVAAEDSRMMELFAKKMPELEGRSLDDKVIPNIKLQILEFYSAFRKDTELLQYATKMEQDGSVSKDNLSSESLFYFSLYYGSALLRMKRAKEAHKWLSFVHEYNLVNIEAESLALSQNPEFTQAMKGPGSDERMAAFIEDYEQRVPGSVTYHVLLFKCCYELEQKEEARKAINSVLDSVEKAYAAIEATLNKKMTRTGLRHLLLAAKTLITSFKDQDYWPELESRMKVKGIELPPASPFTDTDGAPGGVLSNEELLRDSLD